MINKPAGERGGIANSLPAYPRDYSVPEIVSYYAAHSGEAPAVLHNDTVLTYAELEARSNQLARRLRDMGVTPGSFVGILAYRSPETVIAMLATLKCGAANCPLDPRYPKEALEYMIGDCAPKIVLAHRKLMENGSIQADSKFYELEQVLAEAENEDAAPLEVRSQPLDLAYVLYTSGSTGRPKGVMICHRGIIHLVRDQDYANFGPEEVMLHIASLTFDTSIFEIWGALLNGGPLAVVSDVNPSLDEIAAAIKKYGATTTYLTSGLFHLFVDHNLDGLRPIRQLVAGGDILSPTHVMKAAQHLPDCTVINGYGPTENATFSSCYRVPRDGWGGGSVPIGMALNHTQIHILDDEMRPVPEGEMGQLCGTGDGLTLGYLNKPELTAEKYVRNPFSADPEARLYLTGDLARLRPDGAYEFFGRKDRQVKISGKRIELDEIELRLRQDNDVADAIVTVKVDDLDTKRILAYLKAKDGIAPGNLAADVQARLQQKLPDYMIPSEFAVVADFPLTPNGKVDRKTLSQTPTKPVLKKTGATVASDDLETVIAEVWQTVLKVENAGPADNFFDLGGKSLQLMRVHAELQKRLRLSIQLMKLFEFPTIRDLAGYIRSRDATLGASLPGGSANEPKAVRSPASARRARSAAASDIAIIGMAGRFPGANTVGKFWQNLLNGVDCISHFEDSELEDAFSDDVRVSPDFVKARAILDNVDKFDAGFFRMDRREAALTDPQHRIFLECAWEALEDAGYDPAAFRGAIGVFAGCSLNSYFQTHVCGDRRASEQFATDFQVGSYRELLGALPDFLATRVSYKFDLHGPSMMLGTACSTSLLAVSQAAQSLQLHNCDMALAGGVSITFPQRRGYVYLEDGMVSPDGCCRPFDANAQGTVFGSGAGTVLLKRLSDALEDGDHIYATIRGSGVNNDGSRKVGFTAPSIDQQAAAVAAAYAAAGIDPQSVGYIECHGTGTPLGDPIEVAALAKAFGDAPGPEPFCALGSVKANIGHADAAAGVIGLMTAALCLHHKEVPPLLNFQEPNPQLPLEQSQFYFNTGRKSWPSNGAPRRAGVSAFGVGGTNVHVVLEEAAPVPLALEAHQPAPCTAHILPISARNKDALKQAATALAQHLEANPDIELADVAHTLQSGRRHFDCRAAIVCESREEATAKLRSIDAAARTAAARPEVVFMFPGQGSQYPGMACELYLREPVFKDVIDRGSSLLADITGVNLVDALFGDSGIGEDQPHPIRSTTLAQPALYLTEYALAQLFIHHGIKPAAMIGHSVGEFVAASLAGVFSFEDGLRLIAARGRLMQAQPGGGMVAVRLPEAELRLLLGSDLDIAAVNAPALTVAAGPFTALTKLEQSLDERGVLYRRLHTSHAFHSAMMDPVVAGLGSEAEKITFNAPQIKYVSSVTGGWITAAEATSPEYWANHCRAAVRFADGLKTIVSGKQPILVEVGPGRTLATFASQASGQERDRPIITSLPEFADRGSEHVTFAEAIAQLWSYGIQPDWAKISGAGRRRVSLPTYPFQRERHWIDAPKPLRDANDPEKLNGVTPKPGSFEIKILQPDKTQPSPEAIPVNSRGTQMQDIQHQIENEIISILETLSGDKLAGIDTATTFLQLGFDSLLLGQVAQNIQKQFAVKISFRQLFREYPSPSALAQHVARSAPKEKLSKFEPAAPAPAARQSFAEAAPANTVQPAFDTAPMQSSSGTATSFEGLFREQLQAMERLAATQIAALQGMKRSNGAVIPSGHSINSADTASSVPQQQPVAKEVPAVDQPETRSRFRAYRPGAAAASGSDLTPQKAKFIADLVAKYSARTGKSRDFTQTNRARLADPRAASGFRPEWKDAVYPLVCPRAKGSKIWDLDGNEYIDLVNGYGQTVFGHSPDFVVDAISEQLKAGFPIGPQSPLAGEVARMICEVTGNERATFCNTGSEAVMAAMRVARAVTSRDKVVVFGGAYHGQFDEVLVKRGRKDGPPTGQPIAGGIPAASVSNMVVLPYAKEESLDWIAQNGPDLAAVLVEPVQSRHPNLQPREFLQKLRAITEEAGTAFVMDEIVTGFRVHPGGMQHLFGIRADLATYGKVLGGGMPIGVLAGKASFMDALDGGFWQYGDDSVPEVAPTFFAGTFVRHPLVLAAAHSVLKYIQHEGPALQEKLTQRTSALVEKINTDLARRGLKTRAETFSSWFYVDFFDEDRLASLFYVHMRLLGIHVQEGFPCILTTAHTDEDISRIERAFSESLDALQAVGILASSRVPAAAKLPVHEIANIPLTEEQTEVWLAAQLGDEASCAFNESVSLSFEGKLEAEVLSEALNAVAARHDALRGHFFKTGEHMLVRPQMDVPFAHEDFSGLANPESGLKALIDREGRKPFDLTDGPLIRATLAELSETKHTLVLTAHHIICDGWSMNIVMDDLAAFYRAKTSGTGASLPAAASFGQYAIEQSTRETDLKTEAFWLDLYKTLPPEVTLPFQRPRQPIKSFAGATYTDVIDKDLYQLARKTSARLGTSLFNMLFATMQVLLGRLSGESDIVLAVPTAGQSALGEEPLVGHCVKFLPLRVPFDFERPFQAHLDAVTNHVLEAFEHQDYTFGTLVRKLGIKRDLSRLPLTNIQFNLEKLTGSAQFPGAKVAIASNPKAFVNFDLFFNMTESSEGIRIDIDYNTSLFDEATLAQWTHYLRTLLSSVCANPATTIAEAKLLTDREEKWLLSDLNATRKAFPENMFVHELISAQAAKTPGAAAVEYGGKALTYAELDARSNQLARYIRNKVPQADARIAIAVDRSLDMLVSMVAVMKAGHAYVPLDPQHPQARLFQTLETAKVSGIICSGSSSRTFASSTAAIINLDEEAVRVRQEDTSPLPAAGFTAPSTNTAYVIFTSGSTGTPKGVEIPHRSVVNFLTSMAQEPGFTAKDVIVAVTTITFDIAVLELFLPLVTGGKVVIASRDEVRDGFALVRLIASSRATVMQATPSLWQILLEAGLPSGSRLKMLCGGEQLSRGVADALLKTGGELWNVYGPTETTVWSSAGRVQPGSGPITIGEPIANTEMHILDKWDRVVPPGISGDLYIGGEGLALRYFDRPDLTTAAFREISLGEAGPRRLYKTGDIARRLPDGKIQVLGRADQQIKLRGFRIELEEIEAVIRRLPEVAQCAVALRSRGTDTLYLAGYYVQAPGHRIDAEKLSAHASALLPDYMVPAYWVELEALPLNTSNKLDRRALPEPSVLAKKPARTVSIAPRTVLETKLHGIWVDVLGITEIGIDDHLFSLGADSLHLFRIAARMNEQGVGLQARHLLTHPTIAGLARLAEQSTAGQDNNRQFSGPSLKNFRRKV